MTAKTSTFGTGNAAINSHYASSVAGGTAFSAAPAKVSTASSDPAVSAQNNLQRHFWGDYNTLVSKGTTAWFIYTDSRNGLGCPAVDEYQRFLVRSGAVIAQEERGAGAKAVPSAAATGAKPAPPKDCLSEHLKQFGNTDAFVSVITP